ncbi:Gldg family protein [Aurantiacibacter sp. D1-12]|uniref:Gldg family protein n=1 Tax=Aurantiacibacter sp. D1-12 TaxID=2993658 RepID=UPI00237D12E5|nr:ABC transporter [Aurantiacibacter sp. D1-12]MDE1466958.1 ABC transporter [Aurantiacibacter sp. D1-12]
MRSFSKGLAALSVLLAEPAFAQEYPDLGPPGDKPPIALMGTVPIYWGEAADMGELLRGEAQLHWARFLIETEARPVPLDYLGAEALAPFDMLLMAQPRGLTGEENVALDAWVRGGGRLLLFADPMMTGESRFGIGDRRRPQDVALLSPILAHWGLELQFDELQGEGLTTVEFIGTGVPVNMRGRIVAREGATGCLFHADNVIAQCKFGAGEVLVVADAALTDLAGPYPGAEEALQALLVQAFPEFGDNAGEQPVTRADSLVNRGISREIAANGGVQPPSEE